MIRDTTPPDSPGEAAEAAQDAELTQIPQQRTDSNVLSALSMLALTSGNPEAAAAFLRPIQERSEKS